MQDHFASNPAVKELSDPESLRFRQRLLMLHQIGNDLAMVDSIEELCRQAVIQGRQLLECRRFSLWFRQGDTMLMTGSFGVDEDGKIRDERAQLITAGRDSAMGRVLNNKERILINADSVLRNDKGESVGKGAHVVAALWNGSQVIGCVCMDNLLDHKLFVETDFDLLNMYASTIGHLAFRKRAEEDLKKSLKEKEILLREINHRVKNNLQVISSLLSLQAAYVRDPYDAEMFYQSQNRVKSIAKVYETFSKAKDLTKVNIHDYVVGVVQDLFHAYKTDASSITLRWEGLQESLSLCQAIPSSLIINELVTNALKYGFNCGKSGKEQLKGEIRIAIRRLDHSFTIAIENDGNPFPPDVDLKNPRTLGLQLVNALVAQLSGNITLERTRRTKFAITFPEAADGVPPAGAGLAKPMEICASPQRTN